MEDRKIARKGVMEAFLKESGAPSAPRHLERNRAVEEHSRSTIDRETRLSRYESPQTRVSSLSSDKKTIISVN